MTILVQDQNDNDGTDALVEPLHILAERSLHPARFLAQRDLLRLREKWDHGKALTIYVPPSAVMPPMTTTVFQVREQQQCFIDEPSLPPQVQELARTSIRAPMSAGAGSASLAVLVLVILLAAEYALSTRRRRVKGRGTSRVGITTMEESSGSNVSSQSTVVPQAICIASASEGDSQFRWQGLAVQPRRVDQRTSTTRSAGVRWREEQDPEDSTSEDSSLTQASRLLVSLVDGELEDDSQDDSSLTSDSDGSWGTAFDEDDDDSSSSSSDLSCSDSSRQSTRSELMTKSTQPSSTLDVFWARQESNQLQSDAYEYRPPTTRRISSASRHSQRYSISSHASASDSIGSLDLRNITSYLQTLYDEIEEEDSANEREWNRLEYKQTSRRSSDTQALMAGAGRSMVLERKEGSALVRHYGERSLVAANKRRPLSRSNSMPTLSTSSHLVRSRRKSTGPSRSKGGFSIHPSSALATATALVQARRRSTSKRRASFREEQSNSVPVMTAEEFSIMLAAGKQRRQRRASVHEIAVNKQVVPAVSNRRLSYQELEVQYRSDLEHKYRSLEESFHGSSSWLSLEHPAASETESSSENDAAMLLPSAMRSPGMPSKGRRRSVQFSSPSSFAELPLCSEKTQDGTKTSPTSVRTMFLEDDLDIYAHEAGESLTEVSGRLEDAYDADDHTEFSAELLALPFFGSTRSSVMTLQTNTDVMAMSYRLLGAEEFEEVNNKGGDGVISNIDMIGSSLPKVDRNCVSSKNRRRLKNARLVVRVVLGPQRKDYKASVACFEAIDIVTSFRKEVHCAIQELSKGHQVLLDVNEAWSRIWDSSNDEADLSFPSLSREKELDEYEYSMLLVQKIYQRLQPEATLGTTPNIYTEIGSLPQSGSSEDMSLFLGSVGGLPVSLPLNFVDADKYKRTRLTPYKHDQHLPLSLQDALRVVRSIFGPSHKRVSGQDCLRAIQMYGLLKIQFRKLSQQLEAQRSFVRELNEDFERLLDALEMVSCQGGVTKMISDIMAERRKGRRLSATMDTYLVFIASQAERIREELLVGDSSWA